MAERPPLLPALTSCQGWGQESEFVLERWDSLGRCVPAGRCSYASWHLRVQIHTRCDSEPARLPALHRTPRGQCLGTLVIRPVCKSVGDWQDRKAVHLKLQAQLFFADSVKQVGYLSFVQNKQTWHGNMLLKIPKSENKRLDSIIICQATTMSEAVGANAVSNENPLPGFLRLF